MKTIVILSHVGFDDSPYCSYVHNHAKALVKEGYKVIVLAIIHWMPVISNFQKYKKNFMNKVKKMNEIEIIDGVEVRYIKSISFSNLLYNSQINLNGIAYYASIKKVLKKIEKENEVVLIDAHTFKVEGYVAYRLKKKYPNIKTTVTLHGTSFFRNYFTKNGKKSIQKIFGVVDYAICVSNKIQKMLNNINVYNSKVIFNGIEDNCFTKYSEKNKFNYNIISVGTLIPRKNFDITIKVISKLKEKYSNITLTILGVGTECENLKKLVKNLKIEKNVVFKGFLENKDAQKEMAKNDIFLMPSINEGFGIVYIEAMKSGCITIGTKNEGIDGFICNEKNGFLIDPNVDEIVNLIERIYNNEYNLNQIRENAYKSTEKLTWKNNVEEYIKLFNK